MEKKREEEKQRIVRLGLIYNVNDQKFEVIYKDLVSKQIWIGPYDEEKKWSNPYNQHLGCIK
jgi:hypothetical protein